MASPAGFEELLNDFVQAKTGEKIYLDLATENVVQIRPLCKRGSIPLGALWVHVLQHQNNYPVYSYQYKKLYKEGSQYELTLLVDGISLTINLQSGKFFLRGRHVIDWFVSRFPGIMEGYSLPPGQGAKELKDQYTQEELELLRKEREETYKHYIEDWPSEALEKTANIIEVGRRRINQEPIDPEGFLKGKDLETYSPVADLLDEEETLQQLSKLESGRVIQGNVLHRLWKSTLNSWFADPDARIFIVTPHIDCDRLTEVCMLFLNHKLTACLDTMCVSFGNLYGRFAQVRKEAIHRFVPRDQVFIEYKIYGSIVYPVSDFVTSFIAAVKDGKAKVLQTNIQFDKTSFLTIATATALYKEIEEGQFVDAYLNPILG